MARRFFSGSTLEQALVVAARHYEVAPERVAYVLRPKRHGFLRLRRRFVIEVDPDAPLLPEEVAVERESSPQGPIRRREESPAPERRYVEPRITTEASSPEADAVLSATQELVRLGRLQVEGAVSWDGESFVVDLWGSDRERLLRDEAELLGSVEHLVPRLVRGLVGTGVPCKADSRGWRAEHTEEVERLAREAAAAVRRSQETQRLRAMSPADRRLVHLALAEEPGVSTESEGEGFFKRVAVFPS